MSKDDLKSTNTSEAIILNSENTSTTLNDILSKENSKSDFNNNENNSLPKINIISTLMIHYVVILITDGETICVLIAIRCTIQTMVQETKELLKN